MNQNDLVSEADARWMKCALKLAESAADRGEVPVGAVLVGEAVSGEQKIIGEGSNAPIGDADPTAHAEIKALSSGARFLDNYRLPDTTLYVTIEPCTMCFGAMVHARIKRLVYAASEPKAGVITSNLQLHNSGIYNHNIEITSGVLESEARDLMQAFFKQRRR